MSRLISIDEFQQSPSYLRSERRRRALSYVVGGAVAAILMLTLAGAW